MFYKAVLDISMQALALVFVGAALFMHIENWSEDRYSFLCSYSQVVYSNFAYCWCV